MVFVRFSATTVSQRPCIIAAGTPVTAPSNASRSTGTANISVFVVVSVRECSSALRMYSQSAASVYNSHHHCTTYTLLYMSNASYLISHIVSLVSF